MRGNNRKGLQHVLPYEVGEIADRLHRDGLVEEVESLFILDAETTTKGRAVGRKGIINFDMQASHVNAF